MRHWCEIVLAGLFAGALLCACQREEKPKAPAPSSPAPTLTAASRGDIPEVTKASAPAEAPHVFQIVYTRSLGSLPAYGARQKNWFEDHGVQATWMEEATDSEACLDLLGGGKADVAYGVSLPALLEAERGAPGTFRVLGYAAETPENPYGVFLVPKSAAAETIEDLRGTSVAAAGDDSAASIAALVLSEAGSPRPNIAGIELAPGGTFDFEEPDAPGALFAAGPAMAMLTRGAPSEQTTRGIARAPLATRYFSPFPVQAVVIRSAVLQEDAAAVKAFSNANDALLEWCNSNFAELLPVLQTTFGLDDESTLNLFVPRFLKVGGISADDLARAESLWRGEEPSEESASRLAEMQVQGQ